MASYRDYDVIPGVTVVEVPVDEGGYLQGVLFGSHFGLLMKAHPYDLTPDLYPDAEAVVLHGRQISLSQGTNLVDDVIYLLANKDVFRSGMDPEAHYFQYGWKEGRATGSLFDAAFYLSANPDVQAAGVNPVMHYLEYGWREGRDPWLFFDTDFYLRSQPDVAASGMNPFEHYLQYGRYEGRSPNLFFDSALYLSQNPELAAIGGDPLADYLETGWREGRAASAVFNTRVYLAMNPDVQLAGVNPLEHYLRYGRDEGRVINGGEPATITGVDTGLVRDGEIYTASGRLLVDDPDPNQNAFAVQPETGKTLFYGDYDYLTLLPDGHWTYGYHNPHVPNLKLAALPAGAVREEVFTVRTVGDDLHEVRIRVEGSNDLPVIGGGQSAQLDESKSLIAYGALTIQDRDTGESEFREGQYVGAYGSVALAANGAWEYTFSGNAEEGVVPGSAHDAATDRIILLSADGTEVPVTVQILAHGMAADLVL